MVRIGDYLKLTCSKGTQQLWSGPFRIDQLLKDDSVLQLMSVTEQNDGVYVCKSELSNGDIYTKEVNVVVSRMRGMELVGSNIGNYFFYSVVRHSSITADVLTGFTRIDRRE